MFELVTGRTEQTNKLNTFRLEPQGNTAYIRLARLLDYETVTDYVLTVRIQVTSFPFFFRSSLTCHTLIV